MQVRNRRPTRMPDKTDRLTHSDVLTLANANGTPLEMRVERDSLLALHENVVSRERTPVVRVDPHGKEALNNSKTNVAPEPVNPRLIAIAVSRTDDRS
jgi:hypothetical protein